VHVSATAPLSYLPFNIHSGSRHVRRSQDHHCPDAFSTGSVLLCAPERLYMMLSLGPRLCRGCAIRVPACAPALCLCLCHRLVLALSPQLFIFSPSVCSGAPNDSVFLSVFHHILSTLFVSCVQTKLHECVVCHRAVTGDWKQRAACQC
jgi:hypothetical protein